MMVQLVGRKSVRWVDPATNQLKRIRRNEVLDVPDAVVEQYPDGTFVKKPSNMNPRVRVGIAGVPVVTKDMKREPEPEVPETDEPSLTDEEEDDDV